jgi:hypothetical protein
MGKAFRQHQQDFCVNKLFENFPWCEDFLVGSWVHFVGCDFLEGVFLSFCLASEQLEHSDGMTWGVQQTEQDDEVPRLSAASQVFQDWSNVE